MSRLRLLLVALALLTTVVIAAPAAAHDCEGDDGDGDKRDCATTSTTAPAETTTTTTEPEPTTTTEPEPDPTTTTEPEPDPTTTEPEPDPTTTTTAPPTTSTTRSSDCTSGWGGWDRCRTRRTTTTTAAPTTTAPPTVGAPAQAELAPASTSEPVFYRRSRWTSTTTTGVAGATSSSLDPLAWEPPERSTTTDAPVDRSDLELALAADQGDDADGLLGVSDTTLALLLGLVAVGLFATGWFRKWMERG
jgi:outer membrane biosynthesis protein TonB